MRGKINEITEKRNLHKERSSNGYDHISTGLRYNSNSISSRISSPYPMYKSMYEMAQALLRSQLVENGGYLAETRFESNN